MLPHRVNLKNVKKISAARNYSAALTHSGEVYVWGENHYFQLGLNEEIVKNPQKIASGCIDIEAGEGGMMMLFEDHMKIAGFKKYKEFVSVELPAKPISMAIGDVYAAIVDRFGEVYAIGGLFSEKKKKSFFFIQPPALVFEKAVPGFFEGKVLKISGKYSYHAAIVDHS